MKKVVLINNEDITKYSMSLPKYFQYGESVMLSVGKFES